MASEGHKLPGISFLEFIFQPFSQKFNTNVGILWLKTMPNKNLTSSKTILGETRKQFFDHESGQN